MAMAIEFKQRAVADTDEETDKPCFLRARNDAEEALQQAVRAFARWYAETWQTNAEEWKRDFGDEPQPSADWFEGRNDGVRHAIDAAEMFIEEFS